tara:strand:+ start:327 stop:533 length:207 start_codon:yes stop_codon:yes gene_type:complete
MVDYLQLQKHLVQTQKDLQDGTIDLKEASTRAALARSIFQGVKSKITYDEKTTGRVKRNNFMECEDTK